MKKFLVVTAMLLLLIGTVSAAKFTYSELFGYATITGATLEGNEKSLTIPSKIDGYTVSGLGGRWGDYPWDTIVSLSIPETLVSLPDGEFLKYFMYLENFYVSPDNPTYATIDGVLFDKTTRTLVCYPKSKKDSQYTVPEGIVIIGDYAFESNYYLNSIKLASTVERIGSNALNVSSYGSSSFMLTIPAKVSYIAEDAFSTNISSFMVNSANTNFKSQDGVLFSYDGKTLLRYPAKKQTSSYTVPSGVEKIGSYAFYMCSGLESISLPNSVKQLGEMAFTFTKIKQISIPSKVTEIPSFCFTFCQELQKAVVPSTVTSIGYGAFDRCENLTMIVEKDSRAHKYATSNSIKFEYNNSQSWLN